MKKINPDLELAKIRSSRNFDNKSSFKNIFVPIFIFSFAVIGLLGVSFSTNMFSDGKLYTVSIEIVNGYDTSYVGEFSGGEFLDYIISPNSDFESITCDSGDLKYDASSYKIYDDNLTEDTRCTIKFKSNIPVGLDYSDTKKVYDNFGVSYVFSSNSNNYFKYNDMLFRIIRINGDGSLRLLLEDSIGLYSYNESFGAIERWYSMLTNTEGVISSDFNYDVTYQFESLLQIDNCKIENYGLPGVNEMSIYGNSYDNTLLSNKYINGVWGVLNYNIQVLKSDVRLDLRPVINVKTDFVIGNGTGELPYEIMK
ncbi:MAG: hypothetical protein IJ475_02540 [Bacilli bacterium]|nr:hypothetical protein [Bacilli bacterium]